MIKMTGNKTKYIQDMFLAVWLLLYVSSFRLCPTINVKISPSTQITKAIQNNMVIFSPPSFG